MSRGGWGFTETLCFTAVSGWALRTLGDGRMGRPAEPEPSLTLHSLLLPLFLAEVTKFSRRRRSCCSRGTQLALLALVMTALWAGLLTLLLLWREDTPNPQDPHLMFPPRPPLSDPGEPNFPDLPTLGHFPPQTSISSWQVGCGWMGTPNIYPFSPLLSLIHPLSYASDWENARNLKQLEETAAQNGMEGPRGEVQGSRGAETRL